MNDDHRIPCDPLLSACGTDETETLPLQTILDSLTYPFYIIGVADYRVRWANAAARRLHEAGTGACYALTHQREQPCCGPEHPCPMQILRETGKPVVVEHIHQDDQGRRRVVEVHAFALHDRRGRLDRIVEYCVDATEHNRVLEEHEWELAVDKALVELADALIDPSFSIEEVAELVLRRPDC